MCVIQNHSVTVVFFKTRRKILDIMLSELEYPDGSNKVAEIEEEQRFYNWYHGYTELQRSGCHIGIMVDLIT